jgi:hypothetical protein
VYGQRLGEEQQGQPVKKPAWCLLLLTLNNTGGRGGAPPKCSWEKETRLSHRRGRQGTRAMTIRGAPHGPDTSPFRVGLRPGKPAVHIATPRRAQA